MFLNRLIVGFVAGLIATLVYDGIRFLIQLIFAPGINLFLAMTQFGLFITGQQNPTLLSEIIGWAYQFWNGFTFAIMYTLIIGKGKWYYGVAWAMVLELAMVLLYPTYMNVNFSSEFLSVSVVGHIGYGCVLGWLANRNIRE